MPKGQVFHEIIIAASFYGKAYQGTSIFLYPAGSRFSAAVKKGHRVGIKIFFSCARWLDKIYYSNFIGVAPKAPAGTPTEVGTGGCGTEGGCGEPKSMAADGGGWEPKSAANGCAAAVTKFAAAAAAAACAEMAAAEVGSNLSLTMASSCFLRARRSFALRF